MSEYRITLATDETWSNFSINPRASPSCKIENEKKNKRMKEKNFTLDTMSEMNAPLRKKGKVIVHSSASDLHKAPHDLQINRKASLGEKLKTI